MVHGGPGLRDDQASLLLSHRFELVYRREAAAAGAIWREPDPAWTVRGLPEVLYSDHGSDFNSHHLEQVAADLRIQLLNSTAGVPQGRGKIERLSHASRSTIAER